MCGRYYRRSDKQKIAELMRVKEYGQFPLDTNYNIAPSTFQPVIRLDRDAAERELVLMRWGLVPFFAKSLDAFKGFTTINAKAETVLTAPTWRAPIKRRRCLIPVDGFYEWKTSPAADGGKKPTKQPFAFSLRHGEPFAFAGLWDAWKSGPDEWLQSFSIITTEANELMSTVHTRMPVILHPRDFDEWLDRDDQRPAPVHLLRPYESEAMQAAPAQSARRQRPQQRRRDADSRRAAHRSTSVEQRLTAPEIMETVEITAEKLEHYLEANPGATPEYAAQRFEFLDQWNPVTAPACNEGLELLWQFAQQFPTLYSLAAKNDFLDPTHPAFAKNTAWHKFSQHYSTCPKCNEI